ncbi:hypothetical protein QL285_096424 [Trifolium repens]|nr:hypothetical protein QL285_096424 [Trifolium repens]
MELNQNVRFCRIWEEIREEQQHHAAVLGGGQALAFPWHGRSSMLAFFRLPPGSQGRLAGQAKLWHDPIRKNSHVHSRACLAYACGMRKLVIVILRPWHCLGHGKNDAWRASLALPWA